MNEKPRTHLVQRKGLPPVRVTEGKIVLLVSGAATGKTTLTRKWIAKKPDKRARVEHHSHASAEAKKLIEQGIDVAYEALVMPTDQGLLRRVVQTITDPRTQSIEI